MGFEPRNHDFYKQKSAYEMENTGSISKQQFVEIFRAKWGETDPPELLSTAFKLYDMEGAGSITLENLAEITELIGENASEEALQEMMNEAAGVKPGGEDAFEINEEQFMKILIKQTEKVSL
uniref:EF-hand domain-containing protein n=1 Tax=Guillardia theta TaxID=55529 RepID=A0A7S4N9G5_GUITH